MNDLQFHPAANIFPLMTEADFDALVEDVRKNGLREPVALLDGQVIDGRNRYSACLLANVKCRTVDVQTDDPVAYVLSLNLHRRHLTASQRAMIGARVKEFYEKAAKERMAAGGGDKKSGVKKVTPPIFNKGKSRDQIGVTVGCSGPTIDRAKAVLKSGVPELVKAVDSGAITAETGMRVAALPPEEQREVVTADDIHAALRDKQEQKQSADKKRTGVGIFRANEAIDALKRIPKNDPFRKRGFQIVTDWIKANK